MFDIGWGELVVIGVIALIVIGPKELPAVLRTVGRTMNKVRRMAGEFQGQFQEALREAELHDLKKQADDIASTVSGSVGDLSSINPMAETQKEIENAFTIDPGKSEPDKSEPDKSEPAAPPEVLPAPEPQAALPAPDAHAAEPAGAAHEQPPPKSAGSAA
jgi:sec-independent protein translocase protein TatB